MKKGFGLIEVLFAAVVLGFLVVGLTRLQMGNREGILRVRARDVASTIAQDVIDSISTIGSASVAAGTRKCNDEDEATRDLCRLRTFSGLAGDMEVKYKVQVEVTKVQGAEGKSGIKETGLTQATAIRVEHEFAKQVNVTVSWDFKQTTQSINISSVIR